MKSFAGGNPDYLQYSFYELHYVTLSCCYVNRHVNTKRAKRGINILNYILKCMCMCTCKACLFVSRILTNKTLLLSYVVVFLIFISHFKYIEYSIQLE